MQPYSCYVKCYSLPDLFASKMHALMYRQWQTRVKGRDWFDFEWYVRAGHHLHLQHFVIRAQQNGDLPATKSLTPEDFASLLKARIEKLDVDAARRDVMPFVRQPRDLDIWSREYFMRLTDKLRFYEANGQWM